MSDTREFQDRDERKLAELGYKQELARAWSGFSNFAISFTIISVLAGCFTTYPQAWNLGGPIAISWGWPIVVLLILIVALGYPKNADQVEACDVMLVTHGHFDHMGDAVALASRLRRDGHAVVAPADTLVLAGDSVFTLAAGTTTVVSIDSTISGPEREPPPTNSDRATTGVGWNPSPK